MGIRPFDSRLYLDISSVPNVHLCCFLHCVNIV